MNPQQAIENIHKSLNDITRDLKHKLYDDALETTVLIEEQLRVLEYGIMDEADAPDLTPIESDMDDQEYQEALHEVL